MGGTRVRRFRFLGHRIGNQPRCDGWHQGQAERTRLGALRLPFAAPDGRDRNSYRQGGGRLERLTVRSPNLWFVASASRRITDQVAGLSVRHFEPTVVRGGLLLRAHRAERVLDDVGAGERAPEFVRQAEADDGEDLLQPLQDAARDARFLMLQTPDQVAQEPLGLVCVVLVPGLTERLLDARVQMLGQALDDVTALVDLAALDGGGHTEGVSDRFAECLRAIDDEQPRQCRIEPPGEEIVDPGLDDDRVLRRPLDHGQDMLVAVAIDADRRHQDMVADMQTVDLDD